MMNKSRQIDNNQVKVLKILVFAKKYVGAFYFFAFLQEAFVDECFYPKILQNTIPLDSFL